MAKTPHVMVITFPAQGHITPLLQFAKRLASKGANVTLVTTVSMVSKFMDPKATSSINIEALSDGSIEGEIIEDLELYVERVKAVFGQNLAQFIQQHKVSGTPPKVLVYDSHMPWVLDIARSQGLHGAPFFTQSSAVCSIYYHVQTGALELPLKGSIISIPSLPLLRIKDMPSFIYNLGYYAGLRSLVLSQFSNFLDADWILFNTFEQLDHEIVSWMQSRQWPIKTIGPTIPSLYLDKRLEDDGNYGINLFKPTSDACLQWLEKKEIGSVIYVAFGSLADLGEEQMEELAWGLKSSQRDFLWVVRDTEKSKLPSDFVSEASERGLVVNWSSQLQVLSHHSIGCFVTHCGWNSTMEALSLGVPMVAMPQWTDQTTNGKWIEDVWGVGVRVKVNEKGLVTREEIELCINEVMEEKRGNELRQNAMKWKELAKEAVDEGGSSDKNIDEFLSELINCDRV